MADETSDGALELITAVWRYGYARGNILEFRTHLERALQKSTTPSQLRSKALNAAGVLSNMMNDLEQTRRYHEEALEIARGFNNKHHMALALFGLGDIATMRNNHAEAEANYLEAERLYTEVDHTRGIATAQTNLANLYWKQGKLQEALKINEAARRLYESVGDQRGQAWSYTNVGRLSAELRDYGHAAPNLSQAMALYDLLGDRTGIAETLEAYALINIGTRDNARAAQLLGAASRLREEIGHPVPFNDRPSLEKMLADLGESMDGAMETFIETGKQMDLDKAISLALNTSVPSDPSPRLSIAGGEVRVILDRMGITDRELEVLWKLGSGDTDKEIAEHLYISVRTVQTHVQNVLNKFEVTSRSAAVAKAFRIGLLH
jgi:DNA-binding CsgD family transcriptional regulator/tetratricopeptide (TPR) repeat protein